ncbi:MAG: DUF1217 domain-containing protein [Roseomonas sp.]|nr:DUF1217 domain-containing protein [Roseomonas sp.]
MTINASSSLVLSLFTQSGSTALTLPLAMPTVAASPSDAVIAFRRLIVPGAETKGLEQEAKDPITLSAIAQFRQALETAKDLDKALSDPRVLTVLMPALGLPDQVGNPGMVKRALLSDPNDPEGVAAQLGTTWVNAAATLNLLLTSTPKTVAYVGLTDAETTAVASQLRMGEAVMTAPTYPPPLPRVSAFDGLADSVTTALAGQLRPGENATMDRAKLELDYSATLTAVTIRMGELPDSDLPGIVRDALQQTALLIGTGKFDSALSAIDLALTDLESAGGISAEQTRAGRLALMESGIAVAQMARDAFGVAERIEKLVMLDTPDNPAWSSAYKVRLDAFHKDGIERNANFALEVAAAMAQRMVDSSINSFDADLAKSYSDRSTIVLNSRDGRPTTTPIEDVPIKRISETEATAVVEAMKNTPPPNLPRGQLEVAYGAKAALSAITLGETPPVGLAMSAWNALREMAPMVRAGSYASALQRLDDALIEVEADTSLSASMSRDARAALLEASISLEQVRRNAAGVAERIERLAVLDAPGSDAWSKEFQRRLESFHQDGINGNVNFALEVSAAMADRMLTSAVTIEEQNRAQSLYTRSQQVLNGRDGRPYSTSSVGSVTRIMTSEASLIVEQMKFVSSLGSLADPKMLDILTSGYTKYEYRTGLSTTNPGMADAIYFMENAKNMKTAYDILANSVMSRVVLGALGLPIEIAIQPIETQARAITTRMNLADLQNADKVNAFAERFLMAEATAAIAAASVPQDPFAMITSLSIQV